MTHFPATTSVFSQQILLILIFAKCVQPNPLCRDSNAFVLGCLCLCKMLISRGKSHITPFFLSPPFVIIPRGLSLLLYSVCVCVCLVMWEMAVCVWVWKEKTKRWIESTSLIGNVSAKANGGEEEGSMLLICSAVVWGRCLRFRSRYLPSRLCEAVRAVGSWLWSNTDYQRLKHEPDKYVLSHVPCFHARNVWGRKW